MGLEEVDVDVAERDGVNRKGLCTVMADSCQWLTTVG